MNKIPFGPVGLPVFKRTYARKKKDGSLESYTEMIDRCLLAAQNQLKVDFNEAELADFKDKLLNMKGFFAGRFMWQLGTDTVNKLGFLSLMNCAGAVMDDIVNKMCWLFDISMLGCGVGFNIQREYVYSIPAVKKGVKIYHKLTKDADFIVPDSREGWVELLRRILTSFFETGQSFSYSTICIRGAGEPIKTFGGTASGPQILIEGMEQIIGVLKNRQGKKMRPIDVLDVANIIGSIVVAGNVRRSAEIMLGDVDDTQFLRAKRWDLEQIPNWRAMSNNTLICNDVKLLSQEYWDSFTLGGEIYGLFNLKNAQKYGKTGDERYPDVNVVCGNPCLEQSLNDYEVCCLAELVLPKMDNYEELFMTAKYLYRVNKHALSLPAHIKQTEKVVHENYRMGLGITGYLQATEEQKQWLPRLYEDIRAYDREYSETKMFPISVKLTTVKPSGCSRSDSLIITDKGLLKLEEIGNVTGEQWQSLSGLNTHENKITKFYVNGKVSTKKIFTADGNILESSLNHRYKVKENGKIIWKYVKDLKVGDMLLSHLGGIGDNIEAPELLFIDGTKITNQTVIKQPKRMTEDLAWFIGLCFGDGSVHEKGLRISFNRKQTDLIVWLKEFAKETFGIDARIDDEHAIYFSSTQLLDWLDVNGLLKSFSHNIEIPKVIRCSPKSIIMGFIDGFWRADGGVHNSNNNWTVCTISEVFARQFFVLCRSVGLNVKISNAGPGGLGSKDRWIVANRASEAIPRQSKVLRDRFVKTDGWLDPVIKLEDSSCDTFDIEVEDSHQYILNGVVSHNTLSKLVGVTEGCHAAYSEYMIQRIRFGSSSDMLPQLKEAGYKIEPQLKFDGKVDPTTMVVEFPCHYPNCPTVDNFSAVEQMETVRRLQSEWSDNSVSVTVSYTVEEVPAIREYLEKYWNDHFKSVSFLRKSDHGFVQAPKEPCTKEYFETYKAQLKPLNLDKSITQDDLEQECQTGVCPIR